MQYECHDECLILFSQQPISEVSITITSPIFSPPIAESPVKKMGLVTYKKRSVFYVCLWFFAGLSWKSDCRAISAPQLRCSGRHMRHQRRSANHAVMLFLVLFLVLDFCWILVYFWRSCFLPLTCHATVTDSWRNWATCGQWLSRGSVCGEVNELGRRLGQVGIRELSSDV